MPPTPRHNRWWLPGLRWPCGWNLVAVVLLGVTVLTLAPLPLGGGSTTAGAQDFGGGGGRGSAATTAFPVWAKVAVLVAVAAVCSAFFFLVVFPGLLDKGVQPWWPKTACGLCSALSLTSVFALAGLLFWNNLVFGRLTGTKLWYEVWGGRLSLLVVWLLLVSIVLAVGRSQEAKKFRKTTAKKA